MPTRPTHHGYLQYLGISCGIHAQLSTNNICSFRAMARYWSSRFRLPTAPSVPPSVKGYTGHPYVFRRRPCQSAAMGRGNHVVDPTPPQSALQPVSRSAAESPACCRAPSPSHAGWCRPSACRPPVDLPGCQIIYVRHADGRMADPRPCATVSPVSASRSPSL